MLKGERQVASSLVKIAKDHVARYKFASSYIKRGDNVLDALCGIGYGSNILSKKGAEICAFDRDGEAIDYAQKHWWNPMIQFRQLDYADYDYDEDYFDVIVCFEGIEHIDGPQGLLTSFYSSLKDDGLLIISSPNETLLPFSREKFPFHDRHYTVSEFEELLNSCGFKVNEIFFQRDKQAMIFGKEEGRTMVAIGRKV